MRTPCEDTWHTEMDPSSPYCPGTDLRAVAVKSPSSAHHWSTMTCLFVAPKCQWKNMSNSHSFYLLMLWTFGKQTSRNIPPDIVSCCWKVCQCIKRLPPKNCVIHHMLTVSLAPPSPSLLPVALKSECMTPPVGAPCVRQLSEVLMHPRAWGAQLQRQECDWVWHAPMWLQWSHRSAMPGMTWRKNVTDWTMEERDKFFFF